MIWTYPGGGRFVLYLIHLPFTQLCRFSNPYGRYLYWWLGGTRSYARSPKKGPLEVFPEYGCAAERLLYDRLVGRASCAIWTCCLHES